MLVLYLFQLTMQAIPIPLPSLASHHPGTIHINNFTANLNMNYPGVGQEQQQQQYQHQQFQQQQMYQQHQEQTVMAQQLHYQQQATYPAMQGYAQTMGGPFMFVNMEMPLSSYQQVLPTNLTGKSVKSNRKI